MHLFEIAFIEKQQCQVVMDPKQFPVPAKRGGNCEGCLMVVNGLVFFSLGMIYFAKIAVRSGDPPFFAFLWENFDCARCGFFCRVKLLVVM